MTTASSEAATAVPFYVRSSAVSKIVTTLRLTLRNTYAACLNRMPDAYFLPIRKAYVDAPDGSVRQRLFHNLLKGLRYKHPDPAVDTFALADEPSIHFANVNSIVARHLYWFGFHGWEGAEVRAWQYFCSHSKRILEIGANIGFYTVCGAQKARQAEYTAVEPHPHTAAVLRRNLALNGLGRVNIIEAALVGRKTGERMALVVPLADEDDAPPGSFLQSGGELSAAGRIAYNVPVAAIDDLLPGVDLLKLDVEGYEFEILNPVREYLIRERPTIFVEVLMTAKKLQRLIADLARCGAYRIYAVNTTLGEVDPEDVVRGRLGSKYHTRDVLLFRADQALPLHDLVDASRRASARWVGGSRIHRT
jgi:FkbM family methyltransferase